MLIVKILIHANLMLAVSLKQAYACIVDAASRNLTMTDDYHAKGGVARAASLTAEERSAIARRAALARHKKDLPKAVAEGVLEIGNLKIPCAVLDDSKNSRVLTQNGFLRAIGRHPFASGGTGASIDGTPPFLRPKNLKPFISSDLERSTTPLQFLPKNPTSGAGGVGYGYLAQLLPDVCWVYQDAMLAGKLLPSQQHIGEACRQFLKAITNHAIESLVDKATGFDDLQKRRAIDRIIEQYVAKERLPYMPMFELDFYRQIYRLNGWPFDPENTKRPGVIGHYTNDIYDRLAPGVKEVLHSKVKRNPKGRPTEKLTQYLTKEEGKLKLKELLGGVTLLMKQSDDWKSFKTKLDEFFPKFGDTLQLPFSQGNVFKLPKPD